MTVEPLEEAAMPYDPDEETGSGPRSLRVMERHEDYLLSLCGVEGVGIGASETGADVIIVYVVDDAARRRVPDQIEGIPVTTETTGIIDAL